MTDKIIYPFQPGDVVIVNSSPELPMTVNECVISSQTDNEGNPIFGVNVTYLNSNGQPIEKGFLHNILSLYRPVTEFVQPVGFKTNND